MNDTKPDLFSSLDPRKTKLEQSPLNLQIDILFNHLGDLMVTFDDHQNTGRHLQLADDKKELKTRLGYQDEVPDTQNLGVMVANPKTWVIPTIPVKPTFNTNIDSHGYCIYVLEMTYYDLCWHFVKEEIVTVQQKFSNSFTESEVALNCLLLDVTLQLVKKYLI